jgi:hypothetical protein
LSFAQASGGASGAAPVLELRLWKYVDLNSFYRLLGGGPSPQVWTMLALTAAGPLGLLAVAWWNLEAGDADQAKQVWAATIAFTLVINVYVGIYDTILVVPALLTTAARLASDGTGLNPRKEHFLTLLMLTFLVPWVSQPIARATGCQVYSLILLVVASYQLYLTQHRSAVSSHLRPLQLPKDGLVAASSSIISASGNHFASRTRT